MTFKGIEEREGRKYPVLVYATHPYTHAWMHACVHISTYTYINIRAVTH
jgi:hypothetical protein